MEMTTIDIEVIPDEQLSSPDDARVQSNFSSNVNDQKSHSVTKTKKSRRTRSMSITYDTSMIRKIRLTKSKIFYLIPFSIRLCIAFALFTSMAILTSVLIVYCTARKPVKTCQMNFKKTDINPIDYDSGLRSVAIADFNNDTWLDMVVADNVTNNIIIYLGNINGIFSQRSRYSTGSNSNPHVVVVSDFNIDSRSDIAVANFGGHNVGIFLQLENGSFTSQIELSTASSRPIAICLADFDNDTRLDIAIANYGNHSISIFYGHGNGSFSTGHTYSTGFDSFPSSLVTGDFNDDTYMDLAVANYGTDNVGLLLQNGNGTFADQIVFSTSAGSHPISVTVGHFNDDTLLDIAVANSGTNTVGVLVNNGKEMFASQTNYSTDAASPYSIGVDDFNQDNRLDIVVTNKGSENIYLYLGYGNGSFAISQKYSSGSFSSISFAIGDLNKDNRLDIIVVNDDTASIDIWLGSYEGFSDEVTYPTGIYPYSVAVGDFNNDARLDIVVANSVDNTVSVLLGYGNGTFANQTTYLTGYFPCSIAIGDFNNDTQLDIVVVNQHDNTISVLLGYDDGSFGDQTKYPTGSAPYSVGVGDFNKDAQLDIVVANFDDDNVSVLLGYGDGSFADQTTYPTGSSPCSVAVGDFNNDSELDIVVANYDDDTVSVLLGYGDGSFANQTTYPTGSGQQSAAVGDFNNDARLDIVVANYHDDTVSVLLGYGDGSFANQTMYPTGSDPQSVAVGDFNNDAHLDIVVVISQFDGNAGVLLGYGDGSFADQTTYPTGAFPQSVAVGDFNNDTQLDIVVANYNDHTISVLLQHERGFLQNEATYASGNASRLRYFAMADINNDTHQDMVVANYGTNNVGILFGYGNGTFPTQLLFDTGWNSHPSAIAIADFNGDNTLDIIATSYVSDSVPILLGNRRGAFQKQIYNETDVFSNSLFITYGDFNNDRRSEVIVAYDGSDNVNIVVTYDIRFWTNSTTYLTDSSPQSVAVGDFNNDTRLDIVVANFGDNNVSVLLGYGDGSFANQTTYPTGSDPCSVAVGDFNNDSQLDIVVGDNGDVAALLGIGNGFFADGITYPIVLQSSSVAVGDFNNDTRLDIVVTNYDENDVSILLGHLTTAYFKQTVLITGNGSRPRSVVIEDFNNDGYMDVAIANSGTDNIGIFLGLGHLFFTSQRTFSTGPNSSPYSIAAGDFNNDTFLDVVVANYHSDNVGVFLGYGNGSFANQITYSTDYQPKSIAVGDFNNDTILDIVVANYGSNNLGVFLGHGDAGKFAEMIRLQLEYGSHPFSVLVGDFNNDQKLDFAVANDGTDSVNILLQTC